MAQIQVDAVHEVLFVVEGVDEGALAFEVVLVFVAEVSMMAAALSSGMEGERCIRANCM